MPDRAQRPETSLHNTFVRVQIGRAERVTPWAPRREGTRVDYERTENREFERVGVDDRISMVRKDVGGVVTLPARWFQRGWRQPTRCGRQCTTERLPGRRLLAHAIQQATGVSPNRVIT